MLIVSVKTEFKLNQPITSVRLFDTAQEKAQQHAKTLLNYEVHPVSDNNQ